MRARPVSPSAASTSKGPGWPIDARARSQPRQHLGARPQRDDAAALDQQGGVVEDRAGVVAGDERGVVQRERRGHAFARLTAAAGTGNSSGSIGISTIAGLPHASAALMTSA